MTQITETIKRLGGTVTRRGALDMQVCVPSDWTDQQVIDFANNANPSGLDRGWHIRKYGDDRLAGMPERNTCGDDNQRVHIMLDC